MEGLTFTQLQKKNAMLVTENYALAERLKKAEAQLAELAAQEHPDKLRMDWLVSMCVEVRKPLRYGSEAVFHAQEITDEEDENYATLLREQIDKASGIDFTRAVPPAPDLVALVPDGINSGWPNDPLYVNGWNACRAEMLRRISGIAPQQEAGNG